MNCNDGQKKSRTATYTKAERETGFTIRSRNESFDWILVSNYAIKKDKNYPCLRVDPTVRLYL